MEKFLFIYFMEIDATDCYCPVPILRLAEGIKKAKIGEKVILKTKDPRTEEDVPAWCNATGMKIEKISKEGDLIIYEIIKEREI